MAKTIKKIIKLVLHRCLEILAYFSYSLNLKPATGVRVVIFGQGRTGSTLLESLICSTGHFSKKGELLNVDKGEILYPLPYIMGLSKLKPHKNFIFYVKIYQLARDRKRPIDPSLFLETLYNEGFKVIYIKRNNLAKQCLSNMVARKRGAYHKYDDLREKIRISINCEGFATYVKERFRFAEEEKTALSKVEYFEVVYENDLERPEAHQRTIDNILDFLSLERRTATTAHRKINTMPMKKLIKNYDEFADCMKKHGWRSFLSQ